MRLMIIEKGSVNAAVFIAFLIAFLRRLSKNTGREIFVDRGPAPRAKKTGALCQRWGGNCAGSFCRAMRRTTTPAR